MNTRIVCTGTLLLCLVSIVPPARAAELIAAANAMISTREPTNNTGAMSSFCNLPKPAGADIGGMMLFRFDLPPLSGRPVIGDGTFFLHCYWHQSGFHFPYEIRTIPSNDWAEDTVTWANLVGSISNDVWRAIVGNRMAILTVDTSGVTYEWTVSNEVLQSWINNPAVFNHGLAIIPVPDANACWYARQRASFDPERAPRLTFTVQNDPPLTPTNLTPVNGSVDVLRSATLTASAYHDPDGDSHASSR
jgi:hypothetical protein